MNKDCIEIITRKKVLRLYFEEFDTDIDLDDITTIHYDNIMGEILTVSTLLNRIGILRAEAESKVREEEFDLKVFEAQVRDEFRKTLGNQVTTKTGISSWKNATIGEIDDAVIQDNRIIKKRKHLFKIQKDFAIIDSLYWSIKSKDQKINKLSEKLVAEDFEKDLVESKINTIQIRSYNKLIK